MLEIHNIPTSKQYATTAILFDYVSGQLTQIATYSNVCLYQSEFELTTGKLGYRYKMQVSTNIISTVTNGQKYKINGIIYEVTSCKIAKSIGRVPFWQCELKTTNLSL